jgi:MscS family membrane protein
MDILANGYVIWALASAVLLAAALVIGLLWNRVIIPFTLRTDTDLDGYLANAALKPLQVVVVASGVLQVFSYLKRSGQIADHAFHPYIEGLLMAASVLAVTWLVSRILEAVLQWYLESIGKDTGARLDHHLMPLLRRVLRMVLFFVAATIVLGFYDVKITALLGAAGVASLAVALAAQETVANMIGGLTIMIDRPFRIGDRIEMQNGVTGDVREIGMRSTKILTFDRTLVIVPNTELVKQVITNHNYPDPKVCVRQTLGVAYGSDMEKVKRILLEIMSANPRVIRDPGPSVYFAEFGDSSLNLKISFDVGSYVNRMEVLDEINMAINKRFEAEKIDIPFPQRVVHLRKESS